MTTLTDAGWRDVQSFVVDRCNGAVIVRGVSPRTPGARVLIDSPRRRVYVASSTMTTKQDAGQQTDASPLFANAAIRHAIDRREPVLLITLGNGTHGLDPSSGPADHSIAPPVLQLRVCGALDKPHGVVRDEHFHRVPDGGISVFQMGGGCDAV